MLKCQKFATDNTTNIIYVIKVPMNIIVAQRIRELMEEEGLNQSRLAEKVGVKQNTISAWLLGKKEPSIRSLWLLADFFKVDIDYLVGRKDF